MTERRETILLLAGSQDIAANVMRGIGATRTQRGWALQGRPNAFVVYPAHKEAIRGYDRNTEVWLAYGAKSHPAYYDAVNRFERVGKIGG